MRINFPEQLLENLKFNTEQSGFPQVSSKLPSHFVPPSFYIVFMNEIYLHDHTSDWKLAMDAISQHLNGLNDLIHSNLSGYCRLLHGQRNGWDINRLFAEMNQIDENSAPQLSFWWQEWIDLQNKLETEFDIKIPKAEDFEEMRSAHSIERNLGINYDLPIEKLAEIISILRSGEEIPREFFIFVTDSKTPSDEGNDWSEELVNTTKHVLNNLPIASFLNGHCIVKSLGHQFGKISLEDAIAYTYQIRDIDSDVLLYSFDTLDDLIEAGWVVD